LLGNPPDGTREIIEREIKGEIGARHSEVIGDIVIAYLFKKSYFRRLEVENRSKSLCQLTKELIEELGILDEWNLLLEILGRDGGLT